MRLFPSMVPIKFQFPSVSSQTGGILRCTLHQLSPEAQFFRFKQSFLKMGTSTSRKSLQILSPILVQPFLGNHFALWTEDIVTSHFILKAVTGWIKTFFGSVIWILVYLFWLSNCAKKNWLRLSSRAVMADLWGSAATVYNGLNASAHTHFKSTPLMCCHCYLCSNASVCRWPARLTICHHCWFWWPIQSEYRCQCNTKYSICAVFLFVAST